MIRFTQVSKAYRGGRPALQGLNFHLLKGSLTYILGHSGAGKSTLLKLIMAMEKANGGKIEFNGYDITRLPNREIPFLRRQIGMVHQNYCLLPDYNIRDNVALPLIIAGISPKFANKEADRALDLVGLMNSREAFPDEVSGGEQQRVDIARAIVHKPRVLLADEPTGNLDKLLAKEIFYLFERCNQMGMTVLIATHDIDLVSPSKRILHLNHGHLES